jgi:hypothetical protein
VYLLNARKATYVPYICTGIFKSNRPGCKMKLPSNRALIQFHMLPSVLSILSLVVRRKVKGGLERWKWKIQIPADEICT